MAASTLLQVALAANVEAQVVGPNVRRVRLTITAPLTTIAQFRPDSQGNTAGGLTISQNGGVLVLSVEDHGDIVKGPWFGFSTLTQTIGVLETVD